MNKNKKIYIINPKYKKFPLIRIFNIRLNYKYQIKVDNLNSSD